MASTAKPQRARASKTAQAAVAASAAPGAVPLAVPEPAPAPALSRYVTYRLNTLNKINDVISQAVYLERTGLTLAESRCLAAVGAFQQATVNQLALEANLDKSHASRTAQSLVDRGWMVKVGSAHDARSVRLSLTPSGRALCKKVMAQVELRNQELLSCLTQDEQAQLLDMFVRMEAHALQRSTQPRLQARKR